MAKRNEMNPLLGSTETGANAAENASEGRGAIDHLASSVSTLESKTNVTKNSILSTIEEIRSQIEDERAINEALRADLEETRKALAQKEKDFMATEAELGAQKTKAGLIEGLKDEIAFISKEMQESKHVIEKLKSEMAEKDRNINDLQTKIITVEEERSKILGQIRTEMENSMTLQRELAQNAKEKDDVIRERNQLASKYAALEAEIVRLREEAKALDEIQRALTDTRRSVRK